MRNRLLLCGLGLGYVGMMLVLTLLSNAYLRGFAQGLGTSAFISVVGLGFLASTGSLNQMAGAWGEDNTREVLKWAKRRRLVYGWVDNVEVQGGDVDHLVATPAGWIAIDSKWHSRSFDAALVSLDAERATRAARRAALILMSLRHRASVRPVAVCWGGTRTEIPHGVATAHAVVFVSGTHLKRWLRQLPAGRLDRRTAKSVLGDLRQFRSEIRPPDVPVPAAD